MYCVKKFVKKNCRAMAIQHRAILHELHGNVFLDVSFPVSPRPRPVPDEIVQRCDEDRRGQNRFNRRVRATPRTEFLADIENSQIDENLKIQQPEFCKALLYQPLPGQP
jgi:hypothetical protein